MISQAHAPVLRARPSSSVASPTLPRLPVPDLRKTLDKYLESIKPFLLEDDAAGVQSYEQAYDRRVRWAENFENGVGKVCQQGLLELEKSSPHNWFDDNFWLKKAYHEDRTPLIVNSNWCFGEHPGLSIESSTLKVDLNGRRYTPIPRGQAYGSNIVPCKVGIEPDARKLLVMVKDFMYAVEVVDEQLTLVDSSTLLLRLQSIVKDVENRLAAGEHPVPVGVLTTDNRDRWATNLSHLLSLSPKNRATFDTVCRSLIALSLDDYSYESAPPPPSSPCPTDPDLTAHVHNTRSGHGDHPGHNRWYDKPFTMIVESNGRAGALGEHSPVDALVPSMLAEAALVQGLSEGSFAAVDEHQAVETGWERLDWVVDERIVEACDVAGRQAKAIVEDSDADVLCYDRYGTHWMRDVARMAPDGYIQMALQLAWYRSRGTFTATYETVLTRMFHHGRTEALRTLSTASLAWVTAMVDPSGTPELRRELLRRAINGHSSSTREAMTGRGIDRHLLGLRLMLREPHPLFEDELFARSQTWKLSTSSLSAGHQIRGTGFGAAYPDGYGVSYMPAPEKIRFGIESKKSSPLTSTEMFKAGIVKALDDMRELCTDAVTAHL